MPAKDLEFWTEDEADAREHGGDDESAEPVDSTIDQASEDIASGAKPERWAKSLLRDPEKARKIINRAAVIRIAKLLSPETIREKIEEIFDRRLEEVVATTLGFERGWNREWKLNDRNGSALANAVRDGAEKIALRLLPSLLKTAEAGMKAAIKRPKFKKAIQEMYVEKFDNVVLELVQEKVEKKAKIDAVAFVRDLNLKDLRAEPDLAEEDEDY